MKALVISAAFLAFLCVGSRAQPLTPPDLTPPTLTPPRAVKPPSPLTPPQLTPTAPAPTSPIPGHLKPAFDVLTATYGKIDGKKAARPPADSAWVLRSGQTGTGTVEVGFQGTDVVYMIFRRGIGGTPWTNEEVRQVHRAYSHALLKESWFGELYKRLHARAVSNNAAYIYRNDFDVAVLTGGL